MALAGIFSASASPTFSPVCFETEDAAQKHRKLYNVERKPDVELNDKISRANALIQNEEVKLSDLIDILGPFKLQSDEDAQIPVHEWTVTSSTPTMVGIIQHNTQSGYCVDTRFPHYWSTIYTWRGSGYDSPYGMATIQWRDW